MTYCFWFWTSVKIGRCHLLIRLFRSSPVKLNDCGDLIYYYNIENAMQPMHSTAHGCGHAYYSTCALKPIKQNCKCAYVLSHDGHRLTEYLWFCILYKILLSVYTVQCAYNADAMLCVCIQYIVHCAQNAQYYMIICWIFWHIKDFLRLSFGCFAIKSVNNYIIQVGRQNNCACALCVCAVCDAYKCTTFDIFMFRWILGATRS